MLKQLLSVSAWTLVSRLTGFVRDILMAAILGAGPLMDAFAVAFRLPNHFRAIFGEGAFSTAFVPNYTRIRTQQGASAADLFHGRILTVLLASQIVLLVLAMIFTPGFVHVLAPGFSDRPDVFDLTVALTRITFPYLTLVTLVTLWSGALNAVKHFAAAAAAPVLLNIAMIGTLIVSGLFPTPAHAAAYGVLIAGFLEAGLLYVAATRAGVFARPAQFALGEDVRAFFRSFGPAVIGSAGVQIAMLADTIIVTFLPTGGASALYYADRLYQLPLGVIGIAAGTVLLPEMSRLIAAGDTAGAHTAQNRAMGFTLLLAAPFFALFLIMPWQIILAMFGRGAFDIQAADAVTAVLMAYTIGLPAALLIRSAVASFTSRGDTKTPLYASLTAIVCNLLLKLAFWRSMGAAGLALATSVGAWINLSILIMLAWRRGRFAPDSGLFKSLIIAAGGMLAMALFHLVAGELLRKFFGDWFSIFMPSSFVRPLALGFALIFYFIVYGCCVIAGTKVLKVPLKRR